jgi:hypothetical protein
MLKSKNLNLIKRKSINKGAIMGCDIHMYLELKGDEDQWVSADVYVKNRHYDHNVQNDELEYDILEVYGDRNYSLFSSLCGVRESQPGSRRISDSKGFPEDASPETKEERNFWEGDAHSDSWNTLQELYDFSAGGESQVDVLIKAVEAQLIRVAWSHAITRDAEKFRIVYFFDN